MVDRCKIVQGVFIPGCWGTVHSHDKRDCYCDMYKEQTLKKQIAGLGAEIEILKKRLEQLISEAK